MKKNNGELLVQFGLITVDQKALCQQESEKTGKSIYECVVEKKFISAEDIAKTYAEKAGLPYIDTITDKMADLDLLAKVPLKFLRDNEVMPVVIDGVITIL